MSFIFTESLFCLTNSGEKFVFSHSLKYVSNSLSLIDNKYSLSSCLIAKAQFSVILEFMLTQKQLSSPPLQSINANFKLFLILEK